MASADWYREGLRFSCAQCGGCCGGAPGYVWVTDEEQTAIAACLGLPSKRLPGQYARRVGFRTSLVEKSNGDCIFLERNGQGVGCRVYEVRPLQCRTWPFWPINLKSPEHWANVAETCPGMNQGTLHEADRIQEILDLQGHRT